MAKKTILSQNQINLLKAIAADKFITHSFYLGGGTALAEYYLHHRLSEDLDFFTDVEFDPIAISTFFKSHQSSLKIKKIDYQQSFNRNLFFITIGKDVIKTEFTYYPFLRIEKGSSIGGLDVDSALDIAVNKVFTIYQRPRSRDFIDLYLLIKTKKLVLAELVKKARIKFDTHIDPLQLGTQFLKATEVKDFPHMLIKVPSKEWQDFFTDEAEKLTEKILKL